MSSITLSRQKKAGYPRDNLVFLETNRFDAHNRRSLLFSDPVKVISCHRPEEVRPCFLEVEDFLSRGYYAAGFLSYEAGLSFENSLRRMRPEGAFPLVWFGVYRRPRIFRHGQKADLTQRKKSFYRIKNLRPNISEKKYVDNIKRIKRSIRLGNTYQVNYTFKYKFDFSGSVFGLYDDLKSKQSVSYSAFIKTPDFSILSLSPELFFRKDKRSIEVRPMKGTIERGRDAEGDRQNVETLKKSLKNRSENVMIVDLLRNDLGRISNSGSVRTLRLFEVERYETLLQMISIVRATLKRDIAPYELFRAIFPSGSVTGAPKISTMKIINALEKEPRYVYTGSIGFFAPGGDSVFNVAIRTVLVDNKTKKGEMGVGSGIVYDADPHKEFEECKLKADFITQKKKAFRLIETMLWRPGKGYFLLKEHIERLSLSAGYFGFKCDRLRVMRELKELEKGFADADYKVRLLLDSSGKADLSFNRLERREDDGPARIGFSTQKTCAKDIFLYHKTTNRHTYDKEHSKWSKKGYFDVIFTNEKNQVTEGAISNIIIKKGRVYYTSPVECGLLDGIFRRSLFKDKGFPIKEKVLYKKDIVQADEVYAVNSVRGMRRAIL